MTIKAEFHPNYKKTENLIRTTEMNNKQIAQSIGMSREYVRRLRKKLGLSPTVKGGRFKPLPEDAKDKLEKLTNAEICRLYNVSKSVVVRWRKELGLTPERKKELKVEIHEKCKWVRVGDPYRKNNSTYVAVKCICGEIRDLHVSNLKQGKSKMCRNCWRKAAKK